MKHRVVFLCTFASTVLAASASAVVVYQVDRTDDAASGACQTAVPADCPLRQALILANGDGDDSVVLVPDGLYLLTIPGSGEDGGATGDLDTGVGYLWDTTIESAPGSAPVIEQTTDDRVFHIGVSSEGGDGVLTLRGLTLRGGSSPDKGGGIFIYQGPGDAGPGPGWPLVVIEDSVIEQNQAGTNGGGIAITPGIFAGGFQVVVRRTEVRQNAAVYGGGLYGGTYYGSTTIEASRFVDNSASGTGGGLVLFGFLQTIEDTLVAGNHAAGNAGGLYLSTGDVVFRRSAVVGNSAGTIAGSGAIGGGILIEDSCCEPVVEIDNSTIADNLLLGSSPAGRQIAVTGPAELDLEHATLAPASGDEGFPVLELLTRDMTVDLRNTVLDGGCAIIEPASVVTHGYNVERPWDGTTTTTCDLDPSGTGDLVTADLALGPAAIHGGPWGLPTREPLTASPAIFAVPSTHCLPEDQRQAPRPFLFCDAGAHESNGTAPGPWLFADGFESGGTLAWDSTAN